jgi:hypothetical protein
MINDNPAGRLNNILNEFKIADKNATLSATCCKIFMIEPNNTGEILYTMAGIISLIRECKEKVLSLNIGGPKVFLETISSLESAFSNINPSICMYVIQQDLDKATMNGLEFISHFIERDYGNYDIDEDKLRSLQEDVENLINEILNMKLPKEIKDMFIYSLEKIRSAIINYKIGGIDKLRDCMDIGIGQIVRNREILEINNNNQEVQEGSQKYLVFLGKIELLVTIGSKIKEIVEPIIGYISGR